MNFYIVVREFMIEFGKLCVPKLDRLISWEGDFIDCERLISGALYEVIVECRAIGMSQRLGFVIINRYEILEILKCKKIYLFHLRLNLILKKN